MRPNTITLLRLLLVPPILALSYAQRPLWLCGGLGLFLLAVGTDWLDGYLARRRRQVTVLGTILDGAVDTLLILSVFIVMLDRDVLPAWVVFLVLGRELLVMAVRGAKAVHGEIVGANWMGKTKFVMQVVVAVLGYLELILGAQGRALAPGVDVAALAGGVMAVVGVLLALNFLRVQLFAGDMPANET